MNVASKQLCQELYELSGWNCVRDWYFAYHKAAGEVEYDLKLNADESKAGRDDFPAYDVGYLLRKLQTVLHHIEGTDYAVKLHNIVWDMQPEDAACRLAIELFKQGILKPSKGGTDS